MSEQQNKSDSMQLATFYLDDLRFGVDITEIQEINRQHNLTEVPHTPRHVRGVINLRGEVVTVLDLRTILGLGNTKFVRTSRNIILQGQGEPVGLLVDRLSDVVTIERDVLEPPPANIAGVDARFMYGVYQMEGELMVILKIEELASPLESAIRS
jgi:purine-binding chemotaxis protein CheW